MSRILDPSDLQRPQAVITSASILETERTDPTESVRESLARAVVEEAYSWLGTPYTEGQHAKAVGTDCFGLVLGVALQCKFNSALAALRDDLCQGYGQHPNQDKVDRACGRYLVRIARSEAGLGDLLRMRWRNEPHHFAIICSLQPLRVIHAYAAAPRAHGRGRTGKVCETSIDGEWRKGTPWRSLIDSIWRYREIAEAWAS